MTETVQFDLQMSIGTKAFLKQIIEWYNGTIDLTEWMIIDKILLKGE